MAQTVSQAMLRELVGAGAVRSTHVIGQPGGFFIRVSLGMGDKALAAKTGNIRLFRSLDTVIGYLRNTVGIAQFSVDATNYESDQLDVTRRTRPDRAQALRQVHHDAALIQRAKLADSPEAVWHDAETAFDELDAELAQTLKGDRAR